MLGIFMGGCTGTAKSASASHTTVVLTQLVLLGLTLI